MSLSILAITDGTTRVQLLSDNFGLHLTEWAPAVPTPKGGGVWHDSPLSDNRQLALKKWANPVDTFTIAINGSSQDNVIRQTQDLRRLLEKAVAYWTTEWQSSPVWIETVAACEANKRYAIIYDYAASGEGNPFATPFVAGGVSAIENFTLSIEHGFWLSLRPGTDECAAISGTQNKRYGQTLLTSGPTGVIYSLIHLVKDSTWMVASDGDAGAPGNIRRSNNPTVWVASAAGPAGNARTIVEEISTGDLFCITDTGIYKCAYPDHGSNWALASATPVTSRVNSLVWNAKYNSLFVVQDTGASKLWRSTDHGVNWTNVLNLTPAGWSVGAMRSGTILVGTSDGYVYRSADNGATFTFCRIPGGSSSSSIQWIGDFSVEDGLGGVYLSTSTGYIFRSLDDGLSWVSIAQPFGGAADLNCIVYDSLTNSFWIGDGATGQIAQGYGLTDWRLQLTSDVTGNLGIHFTTIPSLNFNPKVIQGGNGNIYGFYKEITLGTPATCTDTVYLANKRHDNRLTIQMFYDASTTTYEAHDLTWFPLVPFNLLPTAGVDVNDIAYFGAQPNYWADVGATPFDNVVINITTPLKTAAGAISGRWEYWDGAAWSILTCTDGTNKLSVPGSNALYFVPPTNWDKTVVNGLDYWWVRFIITAAGPPVYVTVPATDRNPFTVVWNRVGIAASNIVGGDLPALARLQLENVSDLDGAQSVSSPQRWFNRALIGLRSSSRGARFRSFINLSDQQIPIGLIVSLAGASAFASSNEAATSRYVAHTGTATSTWATQVYLVLSPNLARDYRGKFRLFLRMTQTNGSTGEMKFRVNIRSSYGGIDYYGPEVTSLGFGPGYAWQALDLGPVEITGNSAMLPTEQGDACNINIQAWSSAARIANLYDICLIPIDEYAVDCVDKSLVYGSEVQNGTLLEVGSTTLPKEEIRALVKTTPAGFVKSIWQPSAPGPFILQSNVSQQLHVLLVRYEIGNGWTSEPSIGAKVKVYKVQRYFSMRGPR